MTIGDNMADWMALHRSKSRTIDLGLRRELRGFFAAVAYHLLASGQVSAGESAGGTLGKNLIGPYFLKTGLHTVRNQLKAKYKEAEHLLASRRTGPIKTRIWNLTGRAAGDNFFPGRDTDSTCGAWLDGVITGKNDLALGWKNPWSKELTQSSIGAGTEEGIGMVIESRRLADTLGQYNKKYSPEEWPALAVRVYWERLLSAGTPAQRLQAATKLGLTAVAAPAPGPGGGPPPPPPPGGGAAAVVVPGGAPPPPPPPPPPPGGP